MCICKQDVCLPKPKRPPMALNSKYAVCRAGIHKPDNVDLQLQEGVMGLELHADCMLCGAHLETGIRRWDAISDGDARCPVCDEGWAYCECEGGE